MIKKAVIPAAGYGTRFLPITKAVPKELLPIIDTPALSYIVKEAVDSGITDILIIVSEEKDAIKQYFSQNRPLEEALLAKNKQAEYDLISNSAFGVNISYVNQDEQLGLGHAVLQAQEFVGNDAFAVLLGDDVFVSQPPALKQLIAAYTQKQASILGTLEVAADKTHLYGICMPKKDAKKPIVALEGVIEKPKVAPSRSAISGRYVLTPTIFKYLKNQARGSGNEIQLTDAILRMMKEEPVYSLDMTGKRYDIGSKMGYLEAVIDFALDRADLKEDLLSLLKSKLS